MSFSGLEGSSAWNNLDESTRDLYSNIILEESIKNVAIELKGGGIKAKKGKKKDDKTK